MGWQWCPKDPIVKIGSQTITAFGMIPVEFQDQFESMDFTFRIPEGVDAEILYSEPQETVTFVEESGRSRPLRDGGFRWTIGVECKIIGIPASTACQMISVAPWNGACQTRSGTAQDLSDVLVIDEPG